MSHAEGLSGNLLTVEKRTSCDTSSSYFADVSL